MLPLVAAHHFSTPTRLHCYYYCCRCCYCCCCFCNLIMHLIKEMKFLLRLFAYSLASSSRRFYVYPARVWVCVWVCVCVWLGECVWVYCHFVACSVLFAIFHTFLVSHLPSHRQALHFCFRIISLSAVGSLRFYDAAAPAPTSPPPPPPAPLKVGKAWIPRVGMEFGWRATVRAVYVTVSWFYTALLLCSFSYYSPNAKRPTLPALAGNCCFHRTCAFLCFVYFLFLFFYQICIRFR